MVAALLVACAVAPPASAAIPAPPSQWYKLPGLKRGVRRAMGARVRILDAAQRRLCRPRGRRRLPQHERRRDVERVQQRLREPLITNVRALLASSTGTTVYAGTDLGIFKSTGGAWQPVAQGPEADPAQPKKLNQSVQSLVSLTAGPMLAGVFSGGVYKSGDGGERLQGR